MVRAKELCDLGVKQDSALYWVFLDTWTDRQLVTQKEYEEFRDLKHSDGKPVMMWGYPAFSVAELGEMMGQSETGWISSGVSGKSESEQRAVCIYEFWKEPLQRRYGLTEVDARAKMLIWLIKRGKVKP